MKKKHPLSSPIRRIFEGHPILTKICGVLLTILGLIAMAAPIIPGIWLVAIGLGLLGFNLPIPRKTCKKSNFDENLIQPWHAWEAHVVCSHLKTDIENGLTEDEAKNRLCTYGSNQLTKTARISSLRILWNQFKNLFTLILFVAAALSGMLGHGAEAIAISIILLFSMLLGFIQEWRAEHALEALRELITPIALVLRDGVEREVPTHDLVPGDIIMVSTGDRIPADARLLKAINLKIEEAPLTGESVPVEKTVERLFSERAAIGDRKNMVFAGTSAVYGRGRAVVIATGMQTEFGKVAGLLQRVQRQETPLQIDLARVGRALTKAALGIVTAIALLGIIRGQSVLETFVFAIALAVAAVPEALPAVVTISLAIGVQRMSKRQALIRYLPAVETLGCTTYICSDKTGTLTKDEMTVRKIYLDGGQVLDVTGSGYDPHGFFLNQQQPYALNQELESLLRAAMLCSDAELAATDGSWDLKGDPTEAALIVAGAKAGLQKVSLDEQYKRIAEIPFSSETKRMTTLHRAPDGTTIAYVKGAAEILLKASDRIQTRTGTQPLTETTRKEILQAIQQFAQQALRVIGVAYAPATHIEQAENDLIFLGFFGMIDPPRPEVRAAIEKCRNAGIKLMMMTGDHADTAEAIARELTLLEPGGRVVSGEELASMSQNELENQIETISVCARVSPQHKLRVIEALQKRGHIVAMTGDGINDAPALKKANIGVAMGITGTDVAKEAAAMTLLDDNFASIVAAVEEGRIIFLNIQKFLVYLLSSNFGEIGLIVVAVILGLPLPLNAIQILYINLASDGLPALALAVDPGDGEVMRQPPRKLSTGIFRKSLLVFMLFGGLWVTTSQIALYAWAMQSGRSSITVTTMVFSSLVLMQLINTYLFRSHHSIFKRPFANRWLNRAVLWELALLLVTMSVPILQSTFGITALTSTEWVIVIGTALTSIPILELAKHLSRRLERTFKYFA